MQEKFIKTYKHFLETLSSTETKTYLSFASFLTGKLSEKFKITYDNIDEENSKDEKTTYKIYLFYNQNFKYTYRNPSRSEIKREIKNFKEYLLFEFPEIKSIDTPFHEDYFNLSDILEHIFHKYLIDMKKTIKTQDDEIKYGIVEAYIISIVFTTMRAKNPEKIFSESSKIYAELNTNSVRSKDEVNDEIRLLRDLIQYYEIESLDEYFEIRKKSERTYFDKLYNQDKDSKI